MCYREQMTSLIFSDLMSHRRLGSKCTVLRKCTRIPCTRKRKIMTFSLDF